MSPEESHHVLDVLRKIKGDSILVTNGVGDLFQCRITSILVKQCEVIIENFQHFERPGNEIQLGISVLKTSERMEWLVEKATEIGVQCIQFFVSDRSERKNLNLNKLIHVAIGAMKQSGRCWLPKISGPLKFKEILSTDCPHKFIACLEEIKPVPLLQASRGSQSSMILIGPEGDFTNQEMQLARSLGFRPVTLGQYTLRSETAALVAIQTLNLSRE